MSVALRIIPRLDIKGPNLVKGVHLEGLRVLGKPEHFAKYYYEQGADELFYQDVVASLYGRNSLHDIISRTAREVFIPITVGGGIRSLDDVANILRVGADKVSINTAAHENPDLITNASKIFGISTIVVSIEAIKQADGSYMAFTDNGRNYTGREVVSWAQEAEKRGAGEILLTSVDHEGVGKGMNIDLINRVCNAVNIPVVAHGGIGCPIHVLEIAKQLPVSGLAISSILHYQYITKNKHLDGFEEEGNIEFLKSNRIPSSITLSMVSDVKKILMDNNINCRYYE